MHNIRSFQSDSPHIFVQHHSIPLNLSSYNGWQNPELSISIVCSKLMNRSEYLNQNIWTICSPIRTCDAFLWQRWVVIVEYYFDGYTTLNWRNKKRLRFTANNLIALWQIFSASACLRLVETVYIYHIHKIELLYAFTLLLQLILWISIVNNNQFGKYI